MCGIFASFDKERLMALAKANSYRGTFSHSITKFDVHGFSSMKKGLGSFDYSQIHASGFHLCHIQAPTTSEKDVGNIHPAMYRGCMLWHNGIIKTDAVKRLQRRLGSSDKWDTMLLLKETFNTDFADLSAIDGSFACFFYNPGDGLYVFRNEISPLFYNFDGDFSSVRQPGMEPVPANSVFKVDLDFATKSITLVKVFNFKTFDNPYYFPD